MKGVNDKVKTDSVFINGRIEIDPAIIVEHVQRLVRNPDGSKEYKTISVESLQEAVQPIINFYAPKAGRGQSVKKDVRDATISYLKSQGFKENCVWNGQASGKYFTRIKQSTNQNT